MRSRYNIGDCFISGKLYSEYNKTLWIIVSYDQKNKYYYLQSNGQVRFDSMKCIGAYISSYMTPIDDIKL